ncbi:type II toxin-antitoxin system HicA family toxin [Bosea sp. 685]|uniref:type II toxin-antitoxin system HicA family toxin n=1 Tax=Bosea sp. 685 TaxID=3080057 RepID=UPI0028936FED|nr:type II toxin-antitoxin system HicA family toxin [Bosea sp. 685]WNJ88742.1 type II toxin-antitoxin system HicA family toxin [Bosea sp. 685]
MPRLICTYRLFVEILAAHGFVLHRHDGGSHQRWRSEVNGRVYLVDVTPHRINDDIPTGTLKAMIRQSGLSEKLFRR